MLNVDDVYEYVNQRNVIDENFTENISKLYKKNAKWIFPFYDLLCRVVFYWLRPKEKIKYFVLGNRFSHLINTFPKKDICIIGGPRQLLYCLKNNLSYLPNGDFWTLLSTGFTQDVRSSLLKKSCCMQKVLTRLSDRNAQVMLIVENDSLPLQRTFCNIAAAANIKTVCIQHGLFQSKTEAKIIDGWKCDYFICYDNNQKNIITGLGIAPNKVIVGGFYEPITKVVDSKPKNEIKVCFLGQPWFKYGELYKTKYINCIDILTSQLKSANISYSFKPHPWETDAPYLKSMANIFDGNMNDAIIEHDVFLSFTSTALLEVTMAGKLAIQIYDEQFACDNFEKIGYAYTINSQDLDKSILDIIHKSPFELEMPDFKNLSHQIKKLTMVNM
ncbi:MAG TPA: hypothetical protein VH187_03250 [Scandinavium sp.]|jgi:hypothetical protein|uniref:hypothetical protein n=1 Tax=Scandinavium sp. TaxID=2830653 RepID=UPI002E35284A|nr:hypothetical protein [Scandinavium sp.]HEX4500173.1 hypothetical protein [Scandinavium sp.]